MGACSAMTIHKSVLLCVAAASIISLSSCERSHAGNLAAFDVGQPAPDFEFIDQNGQRAHLHQYRGDVVLLNFWATWCPPCVQEMPDLEVLHRRFQGQK